MVKKLEIKIKGQPKQPSKIPFDRIQGKIDILPPKKDNIDALLKLVPKEHRPMAKILIKRDQQLRNKVSKIEQTLTQYNGLMVKLDRVLKNIPDVPDLPQPSQDNFMPPPPQGFASSGDMSDFQQLAQLAPLAKLIFPSPESSTDQIMKMMFNNMVLTQTLMSKAMLNNFVKQGLLTNEDLGTLKEGTP